MLGFGALTNSRVNAAAKRRGCDTKCVDNLESYLNDHLAGSVAAIELLDHLIDEQAGQPLEKFLVDLRDEVNSDQEALRLMRKTRCGRKCGSAKAGVV